MDIAGLLAGSQVVSVTLNVTFEIPEGNFINDLGDYLAGHLACYHEGYIGN